MDGSIANEQGADEPARAQILLTRLAHFDTALAVTSTQMPRPIRAGANESVA
jgi:hypothetical protein